MHALAKERGGECLSTEYANNSTNLLWRCGYCNQTWKARPGNIKMGKWCPDCNHGLGERICRRVMEQLFDHKFPSSWPDWLVNSAGNRMELDGYCHVLKLAFEHQGTQHYRFVSKYHGDVHGLEDQQSRDREKAALCKERGIHLVVIPEVLARLSILDVKPHIIEELKRLHFQPMPSHMNDVVISFDGIYVPDANERLERIRLRVAANGGELLSTTYTSNKTPVEVKCLTCGHVWNIRPHNLFSGKWCSGCSKYRKRYDIADMKELAEKRGGRCLSPTYLGNNIPLRWECSKRHKWEATPSKINALGQWCPTCSYVTRANSKRDTIEDMRSVAILRGGFCLTEAYTDAHTKLIWQCGKCDHKWEATPTSVKGSASRKGTWCPRCAGKK